ncbi:hypothetical protein AAMO2058_000272000 [Amorphochlora amoebiformis]
MGEDMREARRRGIGVSFACGGWLMNYLFGVAKGMQRVGVGRHCELIGSSAGALAAVGLALDSDFDKVVERTVGVYSKEARENFSGMFGVRGYTEDCLEHCGNLQRYKDLGRCRRATVVMSQLIPTLKSIRQSRFKSEEDLKSCLVASCKAFPIAGLPMARNNSLLTDGGFLDFQPMLDSVSTMITVSPFYFSTSDIRPSRYVPAWWALYPPKKSEYEWVFELGFNDACHFIRKKLHIFPWLNPPPPRPLSLSPPHRAKNYSEKKFLALPAPPCLHRSPSAPALAKISEERERIVKWTVDLYPEKPLVQSIERIIGYGRIRSKAIDVCFIVFVCIIWRPIALLLLYLEPALKLLLFTLIGVIQAGVHALAFNDKKSAMLAIKRAKKNVKTELASMKALTRHVPAALNPYHVLATPRSRALMRKGGSLKVPGKDSHYRSPRVSIIRERSLSYRVLQHSL